MSEHLPADYLTSNPRLAILRDDMLADDCETPVKVYMEASRWAADEIERLTAELATMREAHGTYVELYPKVCIERDRLRAALERARAYVRAHVEYGPLEYIARNVDEIAREALAGAPDETAGGQSHPESASAGGQSHPIETSVGLMESSENPWPQEIKEAAYKLDPECWVSYSGKPRDFKRGMEVRRKASLEAARAAANGTAPL